MELASQSNPDLDPLFADFDPTADILAARPLGTGDITRVKDLAGGGIPGVTSRAHERVELVRPIAVSIVRGGREGASTGQVTDASLNSLWVETTNPLAARTPVLVDLSIPGGHTMTFRGRIARVTPDGMAALLYADDLTWPFRAKYLEMAIDPNGHPLTARVRQVNNFNPADRRVEHDTLAISKRWMDVLVDPDDDSVHQAFITECIRRRRLDYATERYRDLDATGHHPSAETYLRQVGKVLAFSALTPKDKPEKEGTLMRKLLMLGAAVAVVLGSLVVAQSMLDNRGNAAPAAADVEEVDDRIVLPSERTRFGR